MPKILEVSEKFRSFEWLHEQYVVNGLSSKQIGNMVGCNNRTIDLWLKKVGIKKRGVGGRKWNPTKEWLTEEYVTNRKSLQSIATEVGEDIKTVHRRLQHFGIKRRKSNPPSGEKSHLWKGGKYTSASRGYKFVSNKNHPRARKNGYILEHHSVAEKILGRYLRPGEVVHHIDFDRGNNDPSNLYVFRTQDAHMRHHHLLRIGKTKPKVSNLFKEK